MATRKAPKETQVERLRVAMFALLSLLLIARGHAQTDQPLDSARGPHGGQVQSAGPYRLELAVGERELVLYVTGQHREPIETTGGSVKAIITGGKERYVVILSPSGGNALKGAGDYKLGRYNLISLMLALPDQELQHAKFVHPQGAKPPPKRTAGKGKGKGKRRAQKEPSRKRTQ